MKTFKLLIIILAIFAVMFSACKPKSEKKADTTSENSEEADLYNDGEANFAAMWAAVDAAESEAAYAAILNGDLSNFAAYWINGRGERPWLYPDGTFSSNQTASGFRKHGDAYTWSVTQGESGFGVMFYPIGVDVMLGKNILETDNTKVRLSYGHDLPDNPKDYFYREADIDGSSGIIAGSISTKINVERGTDKSLSRFDSFNEFYDKENLGEWIVIWPDAYIMDFAFLSINYDYEKDSWVVENALYTIKDWSPYMPFKVNTNVSDGIPIRGIYIRDETDTKYFYISESGFDSSLSLSEFKLRK